MHVKEDKGKYDITGFGLYIWMVGFIWLSDGWKNLKLFV